MGKLTVCSPCKRKVAFTGGLTSSTKKHLQTCYPHEWAKLLDGNSCGGEKGALKNSGKPNIDVGAMDGNIAALRGLVHWPAQSST